MTETQGSGAHRPSASSTEEEHILDRIVATKQEEVASLQGRRAAVMEECRSAPPPRGWARALVRGSEVAVIAEVKRRSPGAGAIRPELDPGHLARAYEAGGARALSVLTDRDYFHGAPQDLRTARAATELPVIRKDFIIHPLQVWEARGMGADAVLLIARILDDLQLRELRELAEELGMDVLVEVHHAEELDRALASGAALVGVNNRDLARFTSDLAVTETLLGRIPPQIPVISESGIRTGEEVVRLGAVGVHGVLMGETLLRDAEPGVKLGEFVGHPRSPRPGE